MSHIVGGTQVAHRRATEASMGQRIAGGIRLGGVHFIGESESFQAMCEQLRRIARTHANALIEGETGTGKELVARSIHYDGVRSSGPFIPVNCGAIPDSLMESEFFGHRRGAFTDAKESAPGIVQLADGGTLFLDEVDSLSSRAQIALLRFLQDRTIRRVGEGTERSVDVRVLAASNTDLGELVKRGTFRQDLYYRLHIMHIALPPLRERGADVLLLARHFLERLAHRYSRAPLELDADSRHWLQRQPWPGNIRQLENLLEREFHMCAAEAVLRLGVLGEPPGRLTTDQRDATRNWNYREAKALVLAEFDRRYLVALMRSARGNITRAAQLAGKERRDLGRLLARYSIAPGEYRVERRAGGKSPGAGGESPARHAVARDLRVSDHPAM
jgi:DNA-binding NtrC family response regulator